MSAHVHSSSQAIVLCRQTIAEHSKSFAMASRVFPPRLRDHAAVIYTWCRRADDAVDHAPRAGQPAALASLRAELDDIYAGRPLADVTLQAFQEVVHACRIPRTYPDELLAGMEMDVVDTAYGDLDELLRYCFRVASTVGLMMSHVMGVRSDDALKNAAHLGIAMQLTNICRDVVEDWQLGRLYLPDALLAEVGAGTLRARLGEPLPAELRAPIGAAVARLLAVAEVYYRSGDRGLAALPWRCAFAVRSARLIYAAIGDRIAAADHDVTAGRAVVPRRAKLLLVGRAGLTAVFEAPVRLARALSSRARPRVPSRLMEFPHDVLPV